MSKILGRLKNNSKGHIARLYDTMLSQVQSNSAAFDIGTMKEIMGVGTESLKDDQLDELEVGLESIDNMANAIFATNDYQVVDEEAGLENLSPDQLGTEGGKFDVTNMKSFTRLQRDAGALGMAAATNPHDVWKRTIQEPGSINSPLGTQQAGAGSTDVGRVSAAMEAYDERAAVQTQVLSYVYNLAVSRQDVFTETVWPTLLIGPDECGVTVTMEVLSVQEEYFRDIGGRHKTMFGRKNLAKALIYPGILHNDTTKLVPVFSDTDPEIKAKFVDEAVLPPREIELENGFVVKTSALKMGYPKDIDLLGISQPDYLVASGLLNETDQLDTKVALSTLYVKLKNGKLLKFSNLEHLPTSLFTPGAQGGARTLNLNFVHPHLAVNAKTQYNDGSEMDGVIKTSNVTARIAIDVRGSVDLNDAGVKLHAGKIAVTDVHNEEREKLAESDTTYQEVEKFFEDAEVVGWYPDARRINTNRREIGQLLAINRTSWQYRIPTNAPITWRRSTADADVDDGAKLEALIKTTYIRASVEAVTRLLGAKDYLEQLPEGFYDPQLVDTNTTLGMASYLIDPYYKHYELDVYEQLNTLRTADRMVDVQAVLINNFRAAWYKAYIHSGYEAACRVLYGANAPKPRVTIATDPFTAMYLSLDGETRTFGHGFDVDVVASSDQRMRGHVFILPGKFNNSANKDTFNPLHFGNRLNRVEIVSAMPIDRGGQTSHEITVQPANDYVIHCGMMVHFTIKNLELAVAEMVPIFKEDVDVVAQKKKKEAEEAKKKKGQP